MRIRRLDKITLNAFLGKRLKAEDATSDLTDDNLRPKSGGATPATHSSEFHAYDHLSA